MVIKALYDAWRSGRVLRHMHDEFLQMLEAGEWMFRAVGQVLFEGKDPDALAKKLYEADVAVNKTERKIRKEIVEHLAIHPTGDLPACLVLMSLVKDAERVGDYCKNLFEIRELRGSAIPEDDLGSRMRKAHAEALEMFDEVRRAMSEGDEKLARRIMGEEQELAQEIERMVREVAASDLPVRDAVCRALCLRHIKRIYAHLFNIGSAVVQPVHKIDFRNHNKLPTIDGKDDS